MEHITKHLPDFIIMGKGKIDIKFIKYARTKFSNISDALIQQNLCEIIAAYDAEFKCKSCCMSINMCPELLNSAGYTYKMNLQANGWIKIEYVPCRFNRARKQSRYREKQNKKVR